MKKFLIFIVAGLLLSMAVLSGCSCSASPELVFADNWSNSAPTGYAETSVYDVALDKNFTYGSYGFIKSEDLSDDKVDFDYKGTYTVAIKTYSKEVVSALDGVKDCGSSLLQEISPIIHLRSTLSLTASFKYGDMTETKDYTDTIVTDSFFSNTKTSLAPIYTRTQSTMSHLMYGKEISVLRCTMDSTTVFDKDSYKFNYKIINITNPEEPIETTTEKDYNYASRTVIDNSQLLFALRNFTLEYEKSAYLKTSSIQYAGLAKDLYVTNFSQTEVELPNLLVNDVNKTNVKVPTNVYSYFVGSDYSGVAQLEFIQRVPDSTTTSSLPQKAMMVKYVEPLLTQGQYRMQGALVYNLKSITYGN